MITQDEMNALTANFNKDEYEVREGRKSSNGSKIQWFVYVRREAIINRFNSVFGLSGWSQSLSDKYIDNGFASYTCTITIRDIAKSLNGTCSADNKSGSELTGREKEKVVKGAATDAFKRASSMWGVGLNLQSCPKIWTDSYDRGDWNGKKSREEDALNQFMRWLNGGSQQNPTRPQQQYNQSPPPQVSNNIGKQETQEDNTPKDVVFTHVMPFNSKTGIGYRLYPEDGNRFYETVVFHREPFRNSGHIAEYDWDHINIRKPVVVDKDGKIIPVECRIKRGKSGYWEIVEGSIKSLDAAGMGEITPPPANYDDTPF